jgi:hypothetical protein
VISVGRSLIANSRRARFLFKPPSTRSRFRKPPSGMAGGPRRTPIFREDGGVYPAICCVGIAVPAEANLDHREAGVCATEVLTPEVVVRSARGRGRRSLRVLGTSRSENSHDACESVVKNAIALSSIECGGFSDRCVLVKVRTAILGTLSSLHAHDRAKEWTPTRARKSFSVNDLRNR